MGLRILLVISFASLLGLTWGVFFWYIPNKLACKGDENTDDCKNNYKTLGWFFIIFELIILLLVILSSIWDTGSSYVGKVKNDIKKVTSNIGGGRIKSKGRGKIR